MIYVYVLLCISIVPLDVMHCNDVRKRFLKVECGKGEQ